MVVSYLQVVKDEEEGFGGKPLVELYSVGVRRRHLVVERQGRARVPHQVLPVKPTRQRQFMGGRNTSSCNIEL